MPKKIIIADDHPISGKGMEAILKSLGLNVIGLHTNGLRAFNDICLQKPEYALLDMQMPGMSGLDILEKIRAKNIKTKIIIYTMFTDISIFKQAKELHADGYLLKEFATDDLKACIRALEKNERWYNPKLLEKLNKSKTAFSSELYNELTLKERAVLKCVANNMSTKEISLEQFISERTVETHRRNIRNKLNLSKKNNALLVWALENKEFFSLMD